MPIRTTPAAGPTSSGYGPEAHGQRLSSSIFITKYVLSAFGLLFLSLILGMILFAPMQQPADVGKKMLAVIVLVGITAFGFFLMRALVWPLADRVDDFGEYLIVQRGRRMARVDIRNMRRISKSFWVNPPRVTIELDTPM